MLHAPMANTRNYGLGPGGLTPEMDEQSMVTTLRRALQSIPHVQGVNNHMGSLLTQQLQPMDWVMKELFRYPVYFIDSRTIASSVAGDVAAAYRIPTMTRDVFLDHEQTEEFVDRQFKLLIKRAKENGSAIGTKSPWITWRSTYPNWMSKASPLPRSAAFGPCATAIGRCLRKEKSRPFDLLLQRRINRGLLCPEPS